MTRAHDALRTACITVLGSGFAPIAPGTWGSMVAVLLWVPIWLLAGLLDLRPLNELALIAGVGLASLLSIRWGPWAIARFGRSDPRPFTLDEFAGQWVALLGLPLGLHAGIAAAACVVVGQFLLFRVADIVKPPPARRLEALPGGYGILLDDLVAGLYANIAGQVLWRLLPAGAWLGVTLFP